MTRVRKQQGFSLLESVLAIGIILVGIVTIISLSTTSYFAGQVTSDQFIAANLAREGMEIVRWQRDTNWLKYDTDSTTGWNENLYAIEGPNRDYTAITSGSVYYAAIPPVEFRPDGFADLCVGAVEPYVCSAVWYDNSNNTYFQTSVDGFDPSAPNIEKTLYRRMIYLNPICRNDADPTDEQVITTGVCASLGAYTQAGIDVVVEVEYPGKGETLTYTLEEYLYDWKY